MTNKPDKPRKPELLFQYRPPMAWAFGNLYRRVLYFNSPLNFNDPHDFRYPPSLRNMKDEHFALFKKAFADDEDARYRRGESKENFAARANKIIAANFAAFRAHVGFSCFSEHNDNLPDNLPMWSHYGGHGKGFCIAFDTRNEWLFADANLAKMQYRDDLPDAADAIRDFPQNRHPFYHSIVHKSREWEYEKEWRLFKGTADKHPKRREVHYDAKALAAIYLGTNASVDTIETISAIAKEEYPHAKLQQARLAGDKYQLEFVDL